MGPLSVSSEALLWAVGAWLSNSCMLISLSKPHGKVYYSIPGASVSQGIPGIAAVTTNPGAQWLNTTKVYSLLMRYVPAGRQAVLLHRLTQGPRRTETAIL